MSDIFELFKRVESLAPPLSGQVEYIVAGLGNPGKQYDGTRHNVGYETVDYACQKLNFKVNKIKFKSLCGEAMISGKRVLFIKPTTFMNLSGQAVTEALGYYKIPIDHLIVISDDISLPPGKLRVRAKGSAGGHNGLKNIIYLTGQDTFPRVKIGVGEKPHPDYDLADWVLSSPKGEEREAIKSAIITAYSALCSIISNGVDFAMNAYNKQ